MVLMKLFDSSVTVMLEYLRGCGQCYCCWMCLFAIRTSKDGTNCYRHLRSFLYFNKILTKVCLSLRLPRISDNFTAISSRNLTYFERMRLDFECLWKIPNVHLHCPLLHLLAELWLNPSYIFLFDHPQRSCVEPFIDQCSLNSDTFRRGLWQWYI